MADYKYGDVTEKIIGAAFRVHGTLGNGFQEIGTRRVDFLVNEKISVELKAIIKLEDVHLAQAINYLEAYNLEIGLLINFGSKRLEFHRFTNKKYNPQLIQHPTAPINPINPSSDK